MKPTRTHSITTRRWLGTLLLAGAASANAAIVDGDTIAIDFGTIAPTGANTFNQFDAYNNTIADGATLAWSTLGINGGVLKNTSNVDVTDVGFTVENQSGQNTSRANVVNGTTGPAPFDIDDIYKDSIISNDQGAAPLDAGAYLVFTFTGLDDSLTYDLSGGYDGNGANFDSTWSFDSGSAGISTTQNDGVASFLSTSVGTGAAYHTRTGLKTDGSGNLKIQITKSFHVNAGSLTLTAVSIPTWQVDASGDWSTPGNWDPSVPNGASAEAIFTDTIPLTGPLTASLDVPVTLGDLSLRSAQAITIGGPSALTLDGGGTASVSAIAGSHVISADVSLADPLDVSLDAATALDISGAVSGTGSVTNSGAGQLSLSGVLTNSGGIVSDAGTLVVSGTGSSSDITVNSGSILSGEGDHSGTLNLAGGNTLSVDPSNGASAFTTGTLSPAAPVTVGFSSSPIGLTDFAVLNYTTYAGTVATDFVNPAYRISFADTGTSITATVAPSATSNWTGADVTNPTFWDNGTSTNWSSADNLFFGGDAVTFTDVGTVDRIDGDTGATVRSVGVQEEVEPGTLTFSNTFGNDWEIQDLTADVETIRAEDGGIVVNGGGNVTMFTKITGNTDIHHTGTGILFLGGGGTDNDFVGTITVDGGGELRNIRNPTGAAGGKFNSLGDFGNTITVSNGSTFDAWVRTTGHDFQNYGTGSFIFGDGTTLSNTGTAHGNDLFTDQLVFDGDVTLSGLMRIDIFDTIDVTGTDITVTLDYVQPSGNIGTVLGGDNSAQSIALWHIVEGTLFVNGADSLGDNANVRVEDGGILRGNRGNAAGDWITVNDLFLEMGSQLQKRDQNNVWNLDGTITVEGAAEIRPGGFDDVIALNGVLTGPGDLTFNNQGLVRVGTGLDESSFTGDLIIGDNAGNKTLQLADLDVGVAETATVSADIVVNETGSENFDVEVVSSEDTLTLSGNISGSGAAGVTKTSAGSLVLSGQNTYSGNSKVYNGTVTLAAGGRQTFYPTANGVNNHVEVLGSGIVNADGEIYFDLSGANTDPGNSWAIIIGAGTVNPGLTFTMNSSLGAFTNNLDGTLTLDDGTNIWTFSLLDGTLSVGSASPFDTWASDNGLTGGNNGPTDDPDSDGDNLYEYFFWDSDPLVAEVFGSELTGVDGSGALSGDLVFSHDRPQDISDVTVTYQWSTDLSGWTDSGASDGTSTVTFVTGTTGAPANGNGADYESVEVTASVTAGPVPSKVFVRVSVAKP